MSVGGTVNISRRLWDDEAFAKEPFSEREAWIWMIAEASWKARKRRVGDYVVPLERGQLAASIRFLASAWSWKHPKVQRFLDRIQKLDLIQRRTDTGVTVITICNYDKYQNQAKAADTPPIQDRYTSDTNEKKGEIREEELAKASSTAKRGTRLPDDWTLPDEWKDWALSQQWPEAAVRLEADKFADFWRSKSGRDATKLDWQMTWRNWMRNSKAPRLIDGRGPPAVGYATQAMELLRQRREQQ